MEAQYGAAITDVVHGVLSSHLWARAGWQEVRRRYRRTAIGPFWTSLSLGIFIFTLGFLWARLWHQDPKTYLPYLCSGMVAYVFVSTLIAEGCTTFVAGEGLIKQLKFPYTVLACTIVWRNLIVFFHNLIIFVLVVLYAGIPVNLNTLLIIPGLLICSLTGIWVALLLGLLCVRYRDVQQIISSLLQIAMFVTPIFYRPDQLKGAGRIAQVVDFNVLYHYIEIIRMPMIGLPPTSLSYGVALGTLAMGWALTLYVYSRFRRRVPYWL